MSNLNCDISTWFFKIPLVFLGTMRTKKIKGGVERIFLEVKLLAHRAQATSALQDIAILLSKVDIPLQDPTVSVILFIANTWHYLTLIVLIFCIL